MIKRSFVLFLLLTLLAVPAAVLAQTDTLPQLMEPIPDPASVLGSVGGPYQENYAYGNITYNTYLYPRPASTEDFLASYSAAAANAGYQTAPDRIENYDLLRIYSSDPGSGAMLMYDYQGYMFLMVPTDMIFIPSTEVVPVPDVPQLIQMGQDAINRQDYQTAIRYLIRAAGSYIQPVVQETPEPGATPVLGEGGVYIVEADDNCWTIAVNKVGVNFEKFMRVNGLTECNIRPGDEVIIPSEEDEMPTMTPIPLDQYTMGQLIQYPVEMNDSYNDIASKFNTTLVSIQQLNNVNVYTTFPQYGQVLTIAVNLVTPTPEPSATPEP